MGGCVVLSYACGEGFVSAQVFKWPRKKKKRKKKRKTKEGVNWNHDQRIFDGY